MRLPLCRFWWQSLYSESYRDDPARRRLALPARAPRVPIRGTSDPDLVRDPVAVGHEHAAAAVKRAQTTISWKTRTTDQGNLVEVGVDLADQDQNHDLPRPAPSRSPDIRSHKRVEKSLCKGLALYRCIRIDIFEMLYSTLARALTYILSGWVVVQINNEWILNFFVSTGATGVLTDSPATVLLTTILPVLAALLIDTILRSLRLYHHPIPDIILFSLSFLHSLPLDIPTQ